MLYWSLCRECGPAKLEFGIPASRTMRGYISAVFKPFCLWLLIVAALGKRVHAHRQILPITDDFLLTHRTKGYELVLTHLDKLIHRLSSPSAWWACGVGDWIKPKATCTRNKG